MGAPYQVMPPLDAATEAALRASIERFGVLVPVLTDQHGHILDGHHRAGLADELGVACPRMIVTVDADADARQIAAELNLTRRHMTVDERKRQVEYLHGELGMGLAATAAALGVSVGTVWNDRQDFNAEKLPERVTGTDGKSYPTRYRPRTEKEHRVEQRRDQLAEQRAAYDAEPTYATDVRRGDFRDVLADLKPGTVDLILTDPPYGAGAVHLYADLAEHAARWLRPGGSLVAFAGHSNLPDVLDVMRPHLRYCWTLVHLQPGWQVTLVNRGVRPGWKPILWFTNGPKVHTRMLYDVIRNDTAPDQSAHRWAQGAGSIVPLIEQLTDPDDLIVDPFAGTASWGVVALGMGRRWIGADLGGAVIPS